MIWIDVMYVDRASYMMDGYVVKKRNPYLANLFCPICGDGSRKKKRGYIYTRGNGLRFHCHNCSYGCGIGWLLKRLDVSLFREYKMFRWNERNDRNIEGEPRVKDQETVNDRVSGYAYTCLRDLLEPLSDMSKDHYVVRYMIERHVPRYRFDDLFFLPKLTEISLNEVKFESSVDRVLIPFRNTEGFVTGITCRDVTGVSDLRYKSLRINDYEPMVWGLNTIRDEPSVFVTEGPLDAMLFDHAISPGHNNFNVVTPYVDRAKERLIHVHDNQPRNLEVCKQLKRSIVNGYRVVVWPNGIDAKDPGEMMKNHGNDLEKIMRRNTFIGNRAMLEYGRWKRC